jgi:hypothetical protein
MAVMMKHMKVVEILHHHLNPLGKVVMMKKNLRRRPRGPRAPKKRKSSGHPWLRSSTTSTPRRTPVAAWSG